MLEGGDAAEQVVRMMLSGGEIAVRLTGSAAKNGAAMLLALAKNHKKVYGKTSLKKMLRQTRDIRTFSMTYSQYVQFHRQAKQMRILYSAVMDKNIPQSTVDIILPVSELERANMVFEKIRYATKNERMAEHETKQEPEPKNAHRSESSSRDTRDNSSTHSEKKRTMNERPSVEQKLKENKAALENRSKSAPTRTRKRTKGKAK